MSLGWNNVVEYSEAFILISYLAALVHDNQFSHLNGISTDLNENLIYLTKFISKKIASKL